MLGGVLGFATGRGPWRILRRHFRFRSGLAGGVGRKRRHGIRAGGRRCLRSLRVRNHRRLSGRPRSAAGDARFTQQLLDGQQSLGVGHFQQTQLKMKALLLPVADLAMRPQHDLQMPRQVLFAEKLGHPRHSLAFVTRDLQQGGVSTRNLSHNRIAQEAHHLPGEVRGAVAFANQPVDDPQHVLARSLGDGLHHFFHHSGGRRPHQLPHRFSRETPVGRSNCLIENRQSVAHGTIARLGQQRQRIFVRRDVLPFRKDRAAVPESARSAPRES